MSGRGPGAGNVGGGVEVRMRRGMGLLLLLCCAGCQGKLFTIKVAESAQTTVERGTLLEELAGDMGFDSFLAMDITSSSELANQGVAPGDVKDVRLTSFELEALEPGGADLSFLESLEVYVEAPDLPRVLLASAGAFPEGRAVVELVVEDEDLTAYVVSESMTFDLEIEGVRPPEDTLVEGRFELAVGVTGQGLVNQL
jgi:hypothetical protein